VFRTIAIGIFLTSVSWLILTLPLPAGDVTLHLGFATPTIYRITLYVAVTLFVLALGEILLSSRYYDYISRLAPSGQLITLVPIAAILVASIRLHFLNLLLHLNYLGPKLIPCDAALQKGQEMGWFEHGSTIIVFAPENFSFSEDVREGARLRMGQSLMTTPCGQTTAQA